MSSHHHHQNNNTHDHCDEWIDVTEFLSNVTSNEMTVGEMIHHPTSFSLLGVIHAIEMMDPKMDAYIMYQNVKINHSTSIMRLSHLTVHQVIELMDQLMCAEFTWFDGHTLPQTVFSCVYFNQEHLQSTAALQSPPINNHNTTTTTNTTSNKQHDDYISYLNSELVHQTDSTSPSAILTTRCIVSYCKALIKGIDELRYLVSISECKDEEEFVYSTMGCYLATRESAKKVQSEMTKLEKELNDHLSKLLELKKSSSSSAPDTMTEDFTPHCFLVNKEHDNKNTVLEDEILITRALLARISYRNAFYQMHFNLRESNSNTTADDNIQHHTSSSNSNVTSDFTSAKKHVTNAKKALKSIIETRSQLRKKFKQNDKEANVFNVSFAFDKYMVAHYSGPTPLKPIDLYVFDGTVDQQATTYLQQMEKMITSVSKFRQMTLSNQIQQESALLGQLVHFFRQFSEMNCHVLIRCRLMHLLVVNQRIFNGGLTFQSIIVKHLMHRVPCMTHYHKRALECWDSNHQTISFIDSYANTCYRLFSEYCNNRSRLRRRLVNMFHSDWANLESNAETLDYALATDAAAAAASTTEDKKKRKNESNSNTSVVRPDCFGLTFTVIDLICMCIEDYLKLGFELQLYHRTEYQYIYWYLEYITHIKMQNSRRLITEPPEEFLKLYSNDLTLNTIQDEEEDGDQQDGNNNNNNNNNNKNKDSLNVLADQALNQGNSNKKKHKNKKSKGNKKTTASSTTLVKQQQQQLYYNEEDRQRDRKERIMSELQALMCRSQSRTISYLEMSGQFQSCRANSLPFGNEERNFERRFDMLQNLIQPPPKSYQDYKAGTNLDYAPLDQLFTSVIEHYASLSQMVDSVLSQDANATPAAATTTTTAGEKSKKKKTSSTTALSFTTAELNHLKSLQKIANTNRIALTLAQKYNTNNATNGKGDAEQQQQQQLKKKAPLINPNFDFSQSQIYPIVKVPKK